uniref:Uncharacterized protein n=1 Tax=Onchocerca volvulus TaxID=6282 RepID=A0A8R1TTV5_ONCVO
MAINCDNVKHIVHKLFEVFQLQSKLSVDVHRFSPPKVTYQSNIIQLLANVNSLTHSSQKNSHDDSSAFSLIHHIPRLLAAFYGDIHKRTLATG